MPPSDPFTPAEDTNGGLKLVDAASESATSHEASASETGQRKRNDDRRSLPLWLFVLALLLFALAIGWQARNASRLEAVVAGLEGELERTNANLDAHRTHLSEIRGGVYALSERLQGLRLLVDTDPTIEAVEESAESPESIVTTP